MCTAIIIYIVHYTYHSVHLLASLGRGQIVEQLAPHLLGARHQLLVTARRRLLLLVQPTLTRRHLQQVVRAR